MKDYLGEIWARGEVVFMIMLTDVGRPPTTTAISWVWVLDFLRAEKES